MKSTLFGHLDAIILDIEGTTTPIDFVYETLFPYARASLERYVTDHWHEDAVQHDVELVKAQTRVDRAHGDAPPELNEDDIASASQSIVAILRWQMDNDRKTTGLKSLQGKIWQGGYEQGELKGRVYDDVLRLFEQVQQDPSGKLCIYSSGSVHAQKLLFAHSEHGDLRPYLSGYYDTTTGPKKEAASYLAIAKDLDVSPERALFLTDNIDEARAAREAGMQVAVAMREGNTPLPDLHGFREFDRFDQLLDLT